MIKMLRHNACRPWVLAFMLAAVWSAQASNYKYHFKKIDRRFDAIAERLNQLDFENRRAEANPKDLQQLAQLAGKHPQLQARSIYWQVRMTQFNARPTECIQQLKKAERLCQPGYDYDLALIRYQLAGNYDRISEYMQCYRNVSMAIAVFRKAKDYYFMGNAQLLLVQLLHEINDDEHASEQLLLAKKSYETAEYPLNRIYFYQAMLTKDDAEKSALLAKSVAVGGRDWAMTMQAYLNLSELALDKEQTQKAAAYYNMGKAEIEKFAPDNVFFGALLSLSHVKILYAQELYAEALSVIESLKTIGPKIKEELFMQEVYRYSWLCHAHLGQKEKAYDMLRLFQSEYERNTDSIRAHDIPKARAREEILRQNDRIRILEKDARIKTTYLYLALLSIALIVFVGLTIIYYLRQRYRIRDIENKQLRENLRQEALIYSMNRKNFEDDLQQKACEISSNTLLLANKNEVLQQISDLTRRFSDEGSIPREYVKHVNAIIAGSLDNDDEWSRFKLHFDSVHPHFFVRLKELCPDLTENDLRLCAYISIGMRAKQIAEMLNVSPDSINSNRYRLRKKFGLLRGQSLDDYIRKV